MAQSFSNLCYSPQLRYEQYRLMVLFVSLSLEYYWIRESQISLISERAAQMLRLKARLYKYLKNTTQSYVLYIVLTSCIGNFGKSRMKPNLKHSSPSIEWTFSMSGEINCIKSNADFNVIRHYMYNEYVKFMDTYQSLGHMKETPNQIHKHTIGMNYLSLSH